MLLIFNKFCDTKSCFSWFKQTITFTEWYCFHQRLFFTVRFTDSLHLGIFPAVSFLPFFCQQHLPIQCLLFDITIGVIFCSVTINTFLYSQNSEYTQSLTQVLCLLHPEYNMNLAPNELFPLVYPQNITC